MCRTWAFVPKSASEAKVTRNQKVPEEPLRFPKGSRQGLHTHFYNTQRVCWPGRSLQPRRLPRTPNSHAAFKSWNHTQAGSSAPPPTRKVPRNAGHTLSGTFSSVSTLSPPSPVSLLTSSHIRATPVTEVLQGSRDLTCSRVHRSRDKLPPMLKLRSSTVFTSPKKQEKISCCKRLAETWPWDPLRGRWERMSLDRRSCDVLQQCVPRDKGLDTADQRRMWGMAELVTDSETCVLRRLRLPKTLAKLPRCKDPRLLDLLYPNMQ